jgi:hypothetical protein
MLVGIEVSANCLSLYRTSRVTLSLSLACRDVCRQSDLRHLRAVQTDDAAQPPPLLTLSHLQPSSSVISAEGILTCFCRRKLTPKRMGCAARNCCCVMLVGLAAQQQQHEITSFSGVSDHPHWIYRLVSKRPIEGGETQCHACFAVCLVRISDDDDDDDDDADDDDDDDATTTTTTMMMMMMTTDVIVMMMMNLTHAPGARGCKFLTPLLKLKELMGACGCRASPPPPSLSIKIYCRC